MGDGGDGEDAGERRAGGGDDVERGWFCLRFPESETPPEVEQLLLEPEEAAELVLRQLGSTALFAAKFRESAARALLLPRRRADGRTPLWQQRKRSYDLLGVASRYPAFPILLEAYRECLRDVFDMPALMETLRAIGNRSLRVHTVDSRTPSPFAAALLFSYVANYIYDGDAPLAERRAQALSIDQDQLRELMGDADLRELLDLNAIEETEEQLQCLAEDYKARTMDGVHDLLLRLGDLTRAELRSRSTTDEVAESVDRLIKARRVLEVGVAGGSGDDCGGGCGAVPGCSGRAAAAGAADGVPCQCAGRAAGRGAAVCADAWTVCNQGSVRAFGLPTESVEAVLQRLVRLGRVQEGGFRPGGLNREWIEVEVLRSMRRKSLARLRKEVEPVEQRVLARLFTRWQGVVTPRRGLDALLDVIENLQGAPLPASIVETEILPARVLGYRAADLDTLIAAGEVVWVGLEPLGERDGRIGLYLAEKLPLLWPPVRSGEAEPLTAKEDEVLVYLRAHGASFFQELHDGLGGGYPGETIEAMWILVWRGMLTNDGMSALRAYGARATSSTAKNGGRRRGGCITRRASGADGRRRRRRRADGRCRECICNGCRSREADDGVEPGGGAPAAGAVRRGVSGDGACGGAAGWVLGGIRRAEGDGGEWQDSAGILCSGSGGDAVCDAGGGGSAAVVAGSERGRRGGDGAAGGDRSGESVWGAAEVAGGCGRDVVAAHGVWGRG